MLSGSADTVTISVYPDCIRNLDYTIMQINIIRITDVIRICGYGNNIRISGLYP